MYLLYKYNIDILIIAVSPRQFLAEVARIRILPEGKIRSGNAKAEKGFEQCRGRDLKSGFRSEEKHVHEQRLPQIKRWQRL